MILAIVLCLLCVLCVVMYMLMTKKNKKQKQREKAEREQEMRDMQAQRDMGGEFQPKEYEPMQSRVTPGYVPVVAPSDDFAGQGGNPIDSTFGQKQAAPYDLPSAQRPYDLAVTQSGQALSPSPPRGDRPWMVDVDPNGGPASQAGSGQDFVSPSLR